MIEMQEILNILNKVENKIELLEEENNNLKLILKIKNKSKCIDKNQILDIVLDSTRRDFRENIKNLGFMDCEHLTEGLRINLYMFKSSILYTLDITTNGIAESIVFRKKNSKNISEDIDIFLEKHIKIVQYFTNLGFEFKHMPIM